MSKCKVCGGESAHNGKNDGAICGVCVDSEMDDDIEVEIFKQFTAKTEHEIVPDN